MIHAIDARKKSRSQHPVRTDERRRLGSAATALVLDIVTAWVAPTSSYRPAPGNDLDCLHRAAHANKIKPAACLPALLSAILLIAQTFARY